MELLTLLKMFLLLGSFVYLFTCLSFIRRHLPKIEWKKKKEKVKDDRSGPEAQ